MTPPPPSHGRRGVDHTLALECDQPQRKLHGELFACLGDSFLGVTFKYASHSSKSVAVVGKWAVMVGKWAEWNHEVIV